MVIVFDVIVFGYEWLWIDVICVVVDIEYAGWLVEVMCVVLGVEIGWVLDWIFLMYFGGKILMEVKYLICNWDDLLMIYMLGVVWVCLVIVNNFDDVCWLIIKWNSVVVVIDGLVVFGFGNIGLKVVLLVMEGKVVLFKWFVGIDVWLLCLDI